MVFFFFFYGDKIVLVLTCIFCTYFLGMSFLVNVFTIGVSLLGIGFWFTKICYDSKILIMVEVDEDENCKRVLWMIIMHAIVIPGVSMKCETQIHVEPCVAYMIGSVDIPTNVEFLVNNEQNVVKQNNVEEMDVDMVEFVMPLKVVKGTLLVLHY